MELSTFHVKIQGSGLQLSRLSKRAPALTTPQHSTNQEHPEKSRPCPIRPSYAPPPTPDLQNAQKHSVHQRVNEGLLYHEPEKFVS